MKSLYGFQRVAFWPREVWQRTSSDSDCIVVEEGLLKPDPLKVQLQFLGEHGWGIEAYRTLHGELIPMSPEEREMLEEYMTDICEERQSSLG